MIWIADPACTSGNPFGACAIAPVVLYGGYVVSGEIIYLVGASGVVSGMVVVSEGYHPYSVDYLRELILPNLDLLLRQGSMVLRLLDISVKVIWHTPNSQAFVTRLENLEQDYNDAKEKGRPTKNYDPNNKDENIIGGSISALEYNPYSCKLLFGEQVDKQNGCPKQIRYYGKDGKAEMDIDFWHGGNPGSHSFPHRHAWRHDLIAQGVTDSTQTRPHIENDGNAIDEIIKYWKCKNYDFTNHKFVKQ